MNPNKMCFVLQSCSFDISGSSRCGARKSKLNEIGCRILEQIILHRYGAASKTSES